MYIHVASLTIIPYNNENLGAEPSFLYIGSQFNPQQSHIHSEIQYYFPLDFLRVSGTQR